MMNRFEASGSPTVAGDRSTVGFCWCIRARSGAPLSPHQVSFQSRLLVKESFFELSLEVAESLDEDEAEELAFEIDVWLARLFRVNQGIRRGKRDVLALLALLGDRDGDRPSTAPGGIQCPEGRHPERVWRPEEGVCGREGIFDFGIAALGSGLGVLRVEGVCGQDEIFDFGIAFGSGLGVLRVEGVGLAAAG